MKESDVRRQAWAMPLTSPIYPRGPYRFVNREFLVISYRTDPELLAAVVPEPLVPAPGAIVKMEFIRMPDSTGFGDYTESGQVIPVSFNGTAGTYSHNMFLNDDAPIAGGREIWGFPKKLAAPTLQVVKDTLTGHLEYAGQPVAIATMGYKHENVICRHSGAALTVDSETILKKMGKTQVNLKLIPHVDGNLAIAQLVAYNLTEINLKGAWEGPARLHLIPHVNAPVADLPVRKVLGGLHLVADLTLPFGRVIYDYLKA